MVRGVAFTGDESGSLAMLTILVSVISRNIGVGVCLIGGHTITLAMGGLVGVVATIEVGVASSRVGLGKAVSIVVLLLLVSVLLESVIDTSSRVGLSLLVARILFNGSVALHVSHGWFLVCL